MTLRSLVLKVILLMFVAQPMFAQATYTCTGPVSGLALNRAGIVTVESLAGMGTVYVCQIGAIYNGVTPEACKAIYATLMSAQLTQKQVRLHFEDDPMGGNCTNRAQWAPLAGWFYGPVLMP